MSVERGACVRSNEARTEELVKRVEFLDFLLGELETKDVCVLLDALLADRLGNADEALLERPPDESLSGRDIVRLRDLDDDRMVEAERADERSPGLGVKQGYELAGKGSCELTEGDCAPPYGCRACGRC